MLSGKKTPEEEAKKIRLTIQGNQFVLRKDGVIVSGDLGYVTNGMSGERAFFVLHPEGKIEFRQSNKVSPY